MAGNLFAGIGKQSFNEWLQSCAPYQFEQRAANGLCVICSPCVPHNPHLCTFGAVGPYMNEKRFVVFVNAVEFYAIWRTVGLEKAKARGETNVRPPILSEIPSDRKWKWQARCWSHGLTNPVPLADVSYDEKFGISFIDGITRTLWLLHHRAPSFPVQVYERDVASALHKAVGDRSTSIASVAQILP